MTQSPSPSSQTDTMVSIRLDGLISILQGLCLDDRTAISVALQAGTSPNVAEGPVANITGPAPDDFPAIIAAHSPTSTTAAPAPAPTAGHVHEPVIILAGLDDGEDSSDDGGATNAAMSLADDSTLQYYNGTYFNVPIEVKAPLYYITRGRYIGIFSGWDATAPKVLGVSRAIYHKAESLEHGVGIVKRAIERGGLGYSNTRCFVHRSKSFGSNKCSGSLLDAPCVMVRPSSRVLDKSKTHCFGPNKYRVQAARDKRRRHYLKCREAILAKRRQLRQERKNCPVNDPLDDEDEPMSCGFDLHVSIETLQDCIAAVKHAKDNFMAYIKAPRRFFDLLVDEYSKTMPDPELYPTGHGDKSVFEHAIESFENFIDRANSGLDGILQMCGICDEWRAADAVCKFMREMVGMVEDILLRLAEGGDSELAVAFMEGELWYQEYKFPYEACLYANLSAKISCTVSIGLVMAQRDNYFWEYTPRLWLKKSGIPRDATNQKNWLSEEQQTFVLTYHESFLECKKNGNFNNFWPPFFEKWEENWPITLEDSSEPLDENARLEQIAGARTALRTRLIVKLRNDFGNSKRGRRANAAGNTIVSKLIGDITIKSGKKKSRPLNATEVYAKKYYASRVQPAVKEELDAMKNALDAPEPKTRAIRVVRKQLASCWENESAEVKEEVAKLAQEMKEKREQEKEAIHDKKELPKEFELHDLTGWTFSVLLAGPDPTNAGKLDVSSLHIGTTAAGNRFNQAYPKFEETIMVPYFEFASRAFPDRHVLADAAVLLSKGTTTPDQNDTSLPDTQARATVSSASDTSLATVPSASTSTLNTSLATVSSASTSTPDTSLLLSGPSPLHSELSGTLLGQSTYDFFQFAPPDLQDDDVDLDFNRTILPMPPNYKPPSPLPPCSPLQSSSTSSRMDWFPPSGFSPLASTSRTSHDISSRDVADFSFAGPSRHDSDNTFALTTLPTSPPRLRHLSSALINTAHVNSRHFSPFNNASASMATPAPAHTPTLVETPTSVQPSTIVPEPPTTEPIMATPSPPATVLPVTTKASKRKSMKSNTHLETVSAKRQKREGAVVPSTESSQPIEGGRGKRQRFQSSRAAAANAIGTT
ncbi:hypothetical protein EV424DRAFT_1349622 [Suillus variegatus]|nr:hypothetical protein EV424DRAFT_1349622 [Suillus variegatus]